MNDPKRTWFDRHTPTVAARTVSRLRFKRETDTPMSTSVSR